MSLVMKILNMRVILLVTLSSATYHFKNWIEKNLTNTLVTAIINVSSTAIGGYLRELSPKVSITRGSGSKKAHLAVG